jgi:6-phosphogluconolactonase (cycloisomerase 2 family)
LIVNQNNGNSSQEPDTLVSYAIGLDGTLSFVCSVASLPSVIRLVMQPQGKYLFAYSNNAQVGLTGFELTSSGELRPVTGSTITGAARNTCNFIDSLLISPNGKQLYLPDRFVSRIRTFDISDAGVPTPHPTTPFTGIGIGAAVASALDHNGKWLFTGTNIGTDFVVLSLSLAADGAPTLLTPVAAIDARAVGMAVDARGRFVYTLTAAGTIYSHRIASDGSLSLVNRTAMPTAGGAGIFKIDAGGRFAYASAGNIIYTFGINLGTGAIELDSGPSLNFGSSLFTFSGGAS